MSASHAEAISDLRMRLLANGYEPIPIIGPAEPVTSAGKRPRLSRWQSCEITPQEIRRWARDSLLARDTNTGIRTGQIIGVDIDVPNAELARAVEDLAIAMLGPTTLRRVGRAPKALLVYQAPEPQPKAETPEFFLPDGTKVQIEILGSGQQFVAHGVHPDTGQPYIWTAQRPEELPCAAVPAVRKERIRAFLAAAESLFRDAGGQTQKELDAANAPPEPPRKDRQSNSSSGGDFFREVNSRALASADAWVKALFPRAYWQPNATTPPGAWRIASADLGRSYEEDIAIHTSEGCQDFGTRESLSPIDLVIRHGGAPDATAAAFWLCEQIAINPEDLGWKARAAAPAAADNMPQPPPMEEPPPHWFAEPEPFTPDPDNAFTDTLELCVPLLDREQEIPTRRWVGGPGGFPRPRLAAIAGPPGVSKTTFALELAICLAAGLPFGDVVNPEAPCRVLLAVIEDEIDEVRRRAHAAVSTLADADHYRRLINENLKIVDISDCVPFFVVSPDGRVGETKGFALLENTCALFRPDLVILDPLLELHTAEESSNSLMRPVMKRLRGFASRHDCAVALIHHEAKSGEGNALQRLRGAGGIGGAIRNLMSLRPMTADEAKEYSVPEDLADLYVRVETGKQQYARKSKPRWLVVEERELANGDRAHLLLPWNAPSVTVTPEMLLTALSALRKGQAGEPCSESNNASASVHKALEAAGLPRNAARQVLTMLKGTGDVEIRNWRDPVSRKPFKRIWVRDNRFDGWL